MRRRSLAFVVAALFIAAACSDDAGSSNGDTADVALPEGPTPAEPGPYGVGRSTVALEDAARDGRAVTVDLWYPVDAAVAASAEPSAYSFIPGVGYTSEVAKADPPAAEGPFPLVVFSHGAGGIRFQSAFLTDLLASHGYVVAAPDHVGNSVYDAFLGTEGTPDELAVDLPADVGFVIDQVLGGGDPIPGDVAAQVDGDRIGVVGHSTGGYTALATAGDVAGHPADERVDAVVGMAPLVSFMEDGTLESVDVPTMLISGTRDETVFLDEDTERAWADVQGGPVMRADIRGAGHQSFSDACLYEELIPTVDDPPQLVVDYIVALASEGCAPDLLEIDRAQELTNIYAVSFLDRFVADRAEAEAYLTDAYGETVPEVEFQRR